MPAAEWRREPRRPAATANLATVVVLVALLAAGCSGDEAPERSQPDVSSRTTIAGDLEDSTSTPEPPVTTAPGDDQDAGADDLPADPGHSSIPELPQEPAELWAADSAVTGETSIRVLPAGGDTALFQLGPDIALLDLTTGAESWRRVGYQDPDGVAQALAVVGSTGRFVATAERDWQSQTALIMDLSTGQVLSRVTVSTLVDTPAQIEIHHDALLLRERDLIEGTTTISRVDPESGTAQWSQTFTHEFGPGQDGAALPELTPTSDPAVLRVATVAADGGSTLHHLDVGSGEVIDTVELGPLTGEVTGAWTEDLLISRTASEDGAGSTLTAWSLTDGGRLWRVEADLTAVTAEHSEPHQQGPGDHDHVTGVFIGSVEEADDSDEDDSAAVDTVTLTRLDPTTGTASWAEPAAGPWRVVPTDTSAGMEVAVLATADHYLIVQEDAPVTEAGEATYAALRAQDGALLGSHQLLQASSLTPGNRQIYADQMRWDGNRLVAYDPADGPLWDLDLGSGRPVFIDDTLLVVDQISGTVRRLG